MYDHGAYDDLTKIATPAAGSGVTFRIPSDWYMTPLSLAMQFVASGAVATRGIALQYQDGDGNVYGQFDQLTLVTAGLTDIFTWAVGVDSATVTAASGPGTKVIPEIRMPSGHKLVIAVSSIQVADQISNVFLWARKWPTGPVELAYGALPYGHQEPAGG